MNWNEILNIVLVVLGVVITFVTYYFKVKNKLQDAVNGSINNAEQEGVSGEDKMNQVVNDLYSLVPVAYKGIFNKEFIRKLVQKAFDKIEEYANKQVNKK